MKKFKLITILITIICFFFVGSAWAQTDEEASPSPTLDPRIEGAIQKRMEDVLKAAEGKKKQAAVGTLKSISNSTLTIETRMGDVQVNVDPETTIIGPKREDVELADLELGSKIIAMGYLEDNVLIAKRIIIGGKFQAPTTEVAFGVVTDISSEANVLTIKHPKKETIYMIEISGNTKITKKVEGKIQTVKFADIEENDCLVAIGEPGENEEKIITAKIIHVIPSSITPATPETEE